MYILQEYVWTQQAAETGEMQGVIDRFETEYKSTKKGWDLGAKAKWVSNLLMMHTYYNMLTL